MHGLWKALPRRDSRCWAHLYAEVEGDCGRWSKSIGLVAVAYPDMSDGDSYFSQQGSMVRDINDPTNIIFMRKSIKAKFDQHHLTIIPSRNEGLDRDFQVVLLNDSLASRHIDPYQDTTWGDVS